MAFAKGPISADPEETVYVVPSTTMVPLVRDSVYPLASLPVTVNVSVAEAVPFLLGVAYSKNLP